MLKQPPLVLASSSPYRRSLLAALGLEFDVDAPDIDETISTGEAPADAVLRLAAEKTRTVAERRPEAVILGGDQCAVIDGDIIGKPGNRENAEAQLRRASGRTVTFLSAVTVVADNRLEQELVPVYVRFRDLDDATIRRYVEADRPFDCAGAIRSEGLGASLLTAIDASDPSALVGLPQITVCRLLRGFGFQLP